MEFLQNILENTQLPIITAIILGLMTAISPCPLATNITAIGFISKDIENRKKVFYNGLAYTLGRTITYTLIGVIFYFGANQIELSGIFQQWGEKVLGPLLIIIGLFMSGLINIKIPFLDNVTSKVQDKNINNFAGALLLGVLFALAFCPYSGVLYFGMLIPLTLSSTEGLTLPIFFAIATGIPVIIFSWLIAFSLGTIGNVYNKIKNFEKWFRKVIAVLFIGVGIYYTIILFL
jgi:cytochrome c biogenesis protein CcdA